METNAVPEFTLGSLSGADLRNVKLKGAIFEGVSIIDTNFDGGDLSESEFYLVVGMGCSFDGAMLNNAVFFGGNFQEASFIGADLTGARFIKDGVGGEVNLCGANFLDAKLEGAKFDSIKWDSNTKLPEEFLVEPQS